MKNGFFIVFLAMLTATVYLQTEDSFPVWKYSSGRTVSSAWNADSSAYLLQLAGSQADTSRSWSPTSMDPRRLVGERPYNGVLVVSQKVDTANGGGGQDTLTYALQKLIAGKWVTVKSPIPWRLASNPDSTTTSVTGAYDGQVLYYRTEPGSSNTTTLLERHVASIHRLIATAGADSCRSYLNHEWHSY